MIEMTDADAYLDAAGLLAGEQMAPAWLIAPLHDQAAVDWLATMDASAFCSSNSLSAVGRVIPRFHREGVVGSTPAASQTRDMGTRLAFAVANNWSRGCCCSMFRHDIGISA